MISVNFPEYEHLKMWSIVGYSIAALSPITPSEPLPHLPDIPRGSLVVVEGRAPIWRYGMALHPASTARPPLPSHSTIRAWVRWWWQRTAKSGRWARWWM